MSKLQYREATKNDLPDIIRMYSEDVVVDATEEPDNPFSNRYTQALTEISSDPQNGIILACLGKRTIGTMQLTYIRYLRHQGGLRCQIEAVRVAHEHRSQGYGTEMFQWVIQQAKLKGYVFVQLTSNIHRKKAQRFYERLGFVRSHQGFRLTF